MIRNSRGVTALAVAGALALSSAVTGCGAGTSPESARPTQLTEGVNVSRKGLDILIRNLFVLGPAAGQSIPVGGSVPVYGTLINSATNGQPDKLVAVSSNLSGVPTPIAGGGLELPVGKAVSLNAQSGPHAVLSGLTKALVGGEDIVVALQFQRAGVVKVTLPVVIQGGDFQTYAPAPNAKPGAGSSASPGATATPGATPTTKKPKKSATPTPTATP